jgi:hypothetical protein
VFAIRRDYIQGNNQRIKTCARSSITLAQQREPLLDTILTNHPDLHQLLNTIFVVPQLLIGSDGRTVSSIGMELERGNQTEHEGKHTRKPPDGGSPGAPSRSPGVEMSNDCAVNASTSIGVSGECCRTYPIAGSASV